MYLWFLLEVCYCLILFLPSPDPRAGIRLSTGVSSRARASSGGRTKLIEGSIILDISYNGTDIKLEFCKNFEKSFHSYISHPYHTELTKYLVYPIYKDLADIKPYIKTSNLKYVKKYFSHGDIVYTGDNHYILKNAKKDTVQTTCLKTN